MNEWLNRRRNERAPRARDKWREREREREREGGLKKSEKGVMKSIL